MARWQVLLVILLLTFNAGWVNSLAFLSLGRVFASFLSGNFVFIGLSVARGDGALLLRAVVAIVSALAGIVFASGYLESLMRRAANDPGWKLVVDLLTMQGVVLFAFAMVWSSFEHPSLAASHQMILLSLAGLAMGIQGVVVGRLNVRGAIANALTGTVLLLGAHLAHRFHLSPAVDEDAESDVFLASLLGLYAMAAIGVVATTPTGLAPFVPATVVLIAAAVVASTVHEARREVAA